VLMKDEGDETLIGDCEDVPLRSSPDSTSASDT